MLHCVLTIQCKIPFHRHILDHLYPLLPTLYFHLVGTIMLFVSTSFFKEPTQASIDLLYFLDSNLCISTLILILFFFLSLWAFSCSYFFLVSLDIRLNCLFVIFLIAWGRPLLLWISFLELLLLSSIDFGSLCFHFHLSLGIF